MGYPDGYERSHWSLAQNWLGAYTEFFQMPPGCETLAAIERFSQYAGDA
jgi:hypothetical protein